jgi:hypothetical protein
VRIRSWESTGSGRILGRARARLRRAAVVAVAAAAMVSATGCVVRMAEPGDGQSWAESINDRGVVVGFSEWSPNGDDQHLQRAYKRYTDDTVVVLDAPVDSNAHPSAINAHEVVVGNIYTDQDGIMAAKWQPDGSVVLLGKGVAQDVNNANIIVGSHGPRAFTVDPTGHRSDLALLANATGSSAYDVNELGRAIGTQTVAGVPIGVVWDLTTGSVGAIATGRPGSFSPTSINDAGMIVGSYRAPDGGAAVGAVLAPGSGMLELIGGVSADAVNEAGTVVVNGSGAAYRWDATHGLVLLAESWATWVRDVNEVGSMVGSFEQKAVFFGVPD